MFVSRGLYGCQNTYPKSPITLHGRKANDFSILSTGLLGRRPGQEVEVENATNDVILEVLLAIVGFVELDIHAIGVQQEDGMRTRLAAVVVVHRMGPVQVAVRRNSVRIASPQGTGVVRGFQTHGISVLSETVEIRVLRKPGTEIQILGLENQVRTSSVEQHLAVSRHSEGEGVLLVIELESRSFAGTVSILGARNNRFRNLVDFLVRIVNHNMEALI